jgi:hypothetical protein
MASHAAFIIAAAAAAAVCTAICKAPLQTLDTLQHEPESGPQGERNCRRGGERERHVLEWPCAIEGVLTCKEGCDAAEVEGKAEALRFAAAAKEANRLRQRVTDEHWKAEIERRLSTSSET